MPQPARATLEKLRKVIKAAAPDADEVIRYQIPTFRLRRFRRRLRRIRGPLPAGLVRKLVKARIAENQAAAKGNQR